MIAFMIGVFVLWLIWRWLCRSTSSYVEIAPPAPTTVNVLTPSIVISVPLLPHPGSSVGLYGLREQIIGAE
jgi:hypothetical protein